MHTRRRAGASPTLSERIYAQLKQMIFDFELLPGDLFSEADIVARVGASRTPVREALQRLRREGYLEVHLRSGWQVRPLDFRTLEQLYDVRIVLECAALERLCAMAEPPPAIVALCGVWDVPLARRRGDEALSEEDRAFHTSLVAAAGNDEMARIHRDVSERIHIVRRLDFTQAARISATYDEHAAILEAIVRRRADLAKRLMSDHIAVSRDEVRKITLHMLHEARERHAREEKAWGTP
ncbi:GntR family transcriptional regulator [Halomonas sp. 328]|nr:GntR family transcriptional regulator [Halomonas sp. 328]